MEKKREKNNTKISLEFVYAKELRAKVLVLMVDDHELRNMQRQS